MLVTFKSKAAAEVVMYEEHAKRILDLFGKDVKRGVITAAETGDAIARLEAEIAQSKNHSASEDVRHDIEAHHGPSGDDNEHEPRQFVSFATRSYPLLEMLRAAHKNGQVVAWGI
jgi:predicted metalloendopeptidase